MERNRITYLLKGYLNNELTDIETDELQQVLLEESNTSMIRESFFDIIEMTGPAGNYRTDQWEMMVDRILVADRAASGNNTFSGRTHRVHFLKTAWFRYAAAIIIFSAGIFFWTLNKKNTQPEPIAINKVIEPGKEGAVLTLSDGTRMVLDSIGNGIVANEGGSAVRIDKGVLQYDGKGSDILYNTMSTPRGRQFQLTLPDGSRVWLNCASSIKYPTIFKGDRIVEVKGEAYFEVVKNTRAPFIVKLPNKASIQVLGTSFNVNSYDDEPALTTTLLEGAIRYKRDAAEAGQAVDLTPGQQIQDQFNSALGVKNIAAGPMEDVVAWKNGLFSISGSNYTTLLRQLARWYDVEIETRGKLPVRSFSVSVSRKIPFPDMLKAMGVYGLKWKMEEGKVIVMP